MTATGTRAPDDRLNECPQFLRITAQPFGYNRADRHYNDDKDIERAKRRRDAGEVRKHRSGKRMSVDGVVYEGYPEAVAVIGIALTTVYAHIKKHGSKPFQSMGHTCQALDYKPKAIRKQY